jgi:hypothetical protein
MPWEAGTELDPVFIDHSEITDAHVSRVIIVVEREPMTAVEPAKFRGAPLLASS